jgi:hypothetical protein
LKNSDDVQDALIEGYFRYNDLSKMEADDILMNISEIENPNYESYWSNEIVYIVLTDLTILRRINQG